ncbi:MAG: U32 family peptidase [Candidatus Nanoarchaeia archaeon]
MKNKTKTELLAPAGDFECLSAAINAGANAVYFGLENFNMRARAKNFKIKDLPKIKKICRQNNVKKYLTLNTIVYDNEIKAIEKTLKKSKKYIDAVICSDLAVMLLCKKYNIPFHVSTQCSVSNSKAAMFYKKLGAERIVLARELNLKEIKKISKIIDIEVFIHGAMCVSISGRCFTSQFLFNESANRGKCLHPCRRFYHVKDSEGNELKLENNYVMSAKDLCSLPFIEKLKKAGVVAFKIEGRNKEPEYVDKVVRVYRKALDKKLTENEINNSLEELNKVYNKGFSSGFYLKIPTSDDFAKLENSNATESKEFLGKITHYYPNIGVGLLKINSSAIKIGDEVLVLGKTTGVLNHKVESMQINKTDINEAKKGDQIGIKLPLCRKNDEVYKVIKKR